MAAGVCGCVEEDEGAGEKSTSTEGLEVSRLILLRRKLLLQQATLASLSELICPPCINIMIKEYNQYS